MTKSFFKTAGSILLAIILSLSLFACKKSETGGNSAINGSFYSAESSGNSSAHQSSGGDSSAHETSSASASGNTSAAQSAGSSASSQAGSSAGASTQISTDKPVFTVLLTRDDEKFEVLSANPVTVIQGEDARFTLRMKNGYYLEKITRKGSDLNADIVNGYDGTTSVSVPNIKFQMAIEASCVIAEAYIAYYPNGGLYIEGGDGRKPYVVGHSLKNRLRPNTEIGTDRIEREGYVLNGWNTLPDGTGEHIGLGSRVTVETTKTLNLYAEWEKCAPASDFDYREDGGKIVLQRYIGKDKKVVVPAHIEGLPVNWLEFATFDSAVETVILPPTIEGLGDGAFYKCPVKELYFYDNITRITDEVFYDCKDFTTVHINAIEAPRYGKGNMYSEVNFADKYDILILNKDKRKLLVFGGSGAYISCDTNLLEEKIKNETGEEIVCLNMAVNGWFNGAAQFDMMAHYMKEGDIFLHLPETSSKYTFMYEVTMTPGSTAFVYNKLRMFYCLEANYDLISLIDYHDVKDLLNGFTEFNKERQDLEEKEYTEYYDEVGLFGVLYERDMGYIDLKGNFNVPRIARGDLVDIGEADIVPELLTEKGAYVRLNEHYSRFFEMGVKVYLTPAPINKDSLMLRLTDPDKLPQNLVALYTGRPDNIPLTYDNLEDWTAAFDNAVREVVDPRYCTVLWSEQGSLFTEGETLFPQSEFFDADYHLCDEAVPVYTTIIADKLIKKWS